MMAMTHPLPAHQQDDRELHDVKFADRSQLDVQMCLASPFLLAGMCLQVCISVCMYAHTQPGTSSSTAVTAGFV